MINVSVLAVDYNTYITGIPLRFSTPTSLSFSPKTTPTGGMIDVSLKIIVPAPALNEMVKKMRAVGSNYYLPSFLPDERGNFIAQLMKVDFLIDGDGNEYSCIALSNRNEPLALPGPFPQPITYKGYINPGPNQVPVFTMTQSTTIWHQDNNASRSLPLKTYIALQLALRRVLNPDDAFLFAALASRVPDYYLFRALPMHNVTDGLDWFDWPQFKKGLITYYENWLESVIEEELDVDDLDPNTTTPVHYEFIDAAPSDRYSEWKDFMQDRDVRTERKDILKLWLPFAIHGLEYLTGKVTIQKFEYMSLLKAFGIFVSTAENYTYDDKLAFTVIQTEVSVPAKRGFYSLLGLKWKGEGKGDAVLLLPVSAPMSNQLAGVGPVPQPTLFPRF